MTDKNLRGRVAVVTGGGRGIGRAIALAMPERVPRRWWRHAPGTRWRRRRAITERGQKAVGVLTDVTSDASVEDLARSAHEQLDRWTCS